MNLRDANDAVNLIALLVVLLGALLELHRPGAGHDLIIGGLSAFGGSAVRSHGGRLTDQFQTTGGPPPQP